jgi:hypothetical protein
MKRAHLSVPTFAPTPEAADLTDRLLDEAKSKRQKTENRKQKAEGGKQKAETPLNALSADSSVPIRSSVPSSADSSVDTALSQSRLAVEALHVAAADVPARYSVALHYRLDALAHHLTQIAEFVETLRK